MKILFVIDTLGPGGKERRLTELLKALKSKQSVEFELVIMSNDIHYEEVFELGIRIHKLIRRTKKDISVYWRLYKLIKHYRPEIVHCWDSMTAFYTALICRLLHCKMINGMVIDTPVRQNIFNKYWLRARLTFPFSDIVVGNSKAGLQAYQAPVSKSKCIYNGINLARFQNMRDQLLVRREILGETAGDVFVIGMVAAFEDRKDYITLIDAIKIIFIKRNDLMVILVGEGKNLDIVKQSIPAQFSDKIVFTGKRSDVEQIINIFDIGVLLTEAKVHGEGISNSIVEYMALAKPVIATRGGGTAEVVINGETGLLVNPSTPEELVAAIEVLLNDPLLRRQMGLAGQERVKNKFSIERMVNEYTDLYQTMLKV